MTALPFTIYHFLILLVILQGLFLAAILLFNEKFQKKSNYVLGGALIGMALLAIGHLLDDLGSTLRYPSITYLPIRYTILLPITLYYVITFLLKPDYQLTKKDYWFLSPLLIQLVVNFVIFCIFLMAPKLVENSPFYFGYIQLREFISIGYSLFVIIVVLKKLKNYQAQALEKQTDTKVSLKWVQNSVYGLFALCILWIIGQLEFFFYGDNILSFHPTWILMGLLVFWLGYFMILRRDIFEVSNNRIINPKSGLSDRTTEHFKRVLQLMEEEKLYRNPTLSMDLLAEKAELSNGYLSQIINQKEGKNFYDFVNAYRVKEVKHHLTNEKYAHYSILGIGLEAGFQSKSTFNAVFKKMTGMTPTQYKKVHLP